MNINQHVGDGVIHLTRTLLCIRKKMLNRDCSYREVYTLYLTETLGYTYINTFKNSQRYIQDSFRSQEECDIKIEKWENVK